MSPIYPNNIAPRSLKIKELQKANAANKDRAWPSTGGRNRSFNTIAMCAYKNKLKYSKKVPNDNRPIACL